jgi:hypothetical protein
MATTTVAAVRDRIIAVVKGLTPVSDSALPFGPFNNELGATFRRWADSNAPAAHRRFQIRDTGRTRPPDISNILIQSRQVTFEFVGAYPQTHLWGGDNALDRDDVMRQDQEQIWHAVGPAGRENFTPSAYPDAFWRGGEVLDRAIGRACDFLIIRLTMEFQLAVA